MYRKYYAGQAYDQFECEALRGYSGDHPEAWKVRPCEWYKDEYNNCANFFQRFNQRFIYGHGLDCDRWKKDYKNCLVFRNTGDESYMQKVIDSENQRLTKFVTGVQGNDVWQYRTTQPPNWNRKLPDWWDQKIENTHLNRYMQSVAKELKNNNSQEQPSS